MNELPEQNLPESGPISSRPLPQVWRFLGWGFCFSVITYGIIDTLAEFGVMDWDSSNTAQSALPGIAFLLGGYLGVTTKASSKKLIIVTICFPVTIALLSPLIRYNATKAISEYKNGVASFEQGDADAAIACFTRAMELKPDYALPYAGRGFIYSAKGDHNKAIADLDKAIQLDATIGETYFFRGVAYQELGDADKADADFARAKELGFEP